VLAARLSDDPDVRVLLLEAGGENTATEIQVPAMFPLAFKSGLDWDLFGEREPGLGGRRLYLPRGRVIGGSGSINAMIYLRGHRADFDGWAADGCTGWSYDEVLPYFKRSEDNERGESEFHGVGGPLAVSDSRSMCPLIEAQLEAAVARGTRTSRTSTSIGPRASPASSSRSGTGSVAAPPTRSFGPPGDGRTSRCARACSSSASSSRATARWASSFSRAAPARPCAPSAR
jgi:choline dehydrogenase-like flavoprotein